MPKIVHVAKAQQRYATVAVLNDDGTPQQSPVCHAGTFVQKTTKRGTPVFRTVTAPDKTQPLPLHECDFKNCPEPTIDVGTSYKHRTVKTGPTSSRTYTRHESCPDWNTWDYSNSLSARVAHIVFDAQSEIAAATETGEVESALASAAEEVREIAEEKRAAAANMEEGFGGATTQSEELAEQADALEEWADALAAADIPDKTECPECDGDGETDCVVCESLATEECPDCNGDGKIDGEECETCTGDGTVDCSECDGTGSTSCESCEDGYDFDTWREAADEAAAVLDEAPF